MKIGSFVISRERKVRATVAEKVQAHISSDQVREAIARMARSEVKNYMAEVAEEAEVAFTTPAEFLGMVTKYASYSGTKPYTMIDGTSATFTTSNELRSASDANSDSL